MLDRINDVRHALNRMIDAGTVERRGSKRNFEYRVVTR